MVIFSFLPFAWYWQILIAWAVLSLLNMLLFVPLGHKVLDDGRSFTEDDIKNSIRFAPFVTIYYVVGIVFVKIFGAFEYLPKIINYIYGLGKEKNANRCR